jgi:hypothetical protein
VKEKNHRRLFLRSSGLSFCDQRKLKSNRKESALRKTPQPLIVKESKYFDEPAEYEQVPQQEWDDLFESAFDALNSASLDVL